MDDVTLILDTRPQNLSATSVEGFDFGLNYTSTTEGGALSGIVAITVLTEFEEQFSDTTPVEDRLGTFGNPADLRVRAGVTWEEGVFLSGVFVNHTGGYTDDQAVSGPFDVDSFTTVDVNFNLDFGTNSSLSFLDNAFLNFSILNIFDENPPEIGGRPFDQPIFDNVNANPAGRSFVLLLAKQF